MQLQSHKRKSVPWPYPTTSTYMSPGLSPSRVTTYSVSLSSTPGGGGFSYGGGSGCPQTAGRALLSGTPFLELGGPPLHCSASMLVPQPAIPHFPLLSCTRTVGCSVTLAREDSLCGRATGMATSSLSGSGPVSTPGGLSSWASPGLKTTPVPLQRSCCTKFQEGTPVVPLAF